MVSNRQVRVELPDSYDPRHICEVKINGQAVMPGTEVSIFNESGRFRFQYASVSSQGLLSLTFVGGPEKHRTTRSFRPERVRVVHRIEKMRPVKFKERSA